MYMREGEPETVREPWLNMTWAVAAVVTVAASLVPQFLFAWASEAVLRLF
jgi:hypothetical protein